MKSSNLVNKAGNLFSAVSRGGSRGSDTGFTRNGVIKTLMIVFLILYLGFLYSSNNAADIPMSEIASEMVSRTTVSAMEQRGRADLKRYYSMDEGTLDGCLFFKDSSPMSVNEMLIVKAKSALETEPLLQNAQAHLESQKTVFGGYGTDQMALLGKAYVGSKGKYVYYFCGPDADDWRDTFMSLI